MKKLAKEISTDQHKEKDNELKKLNKDLLELRKIIDQPHSTEEDKIAYNDLKKTIDNKLKDKEGAKGFGQESIRLCTMKNPPNIFLTRKRKGESQNKLIF